MCNLNIINLTPHELNIRLLDGSEKNVAPSGLVARLDETREEVSSGNLPPDLAGIPITRATYGAPYVIGAEGEPDSFPHPEHGCIYVVSGMMLSHPQIQNRVDVFAPGPAIRNEEGRIVGCDGLSATTPSWVRKPGRHVYTPDNGNDYVIVAVQGDNALHTGIVAARGTRERLANHYRELTANLFDEADEHGTSYISTHGNEHCVLMTWDTWQRV